MGSKKSIKREAVLSTNEDFKCFCNFPDFLFVGVISGNIKPGGAAGDKSRVLGIPEFCKKSSLETVWLISFNDFLKPVSENRLVASTC